MKENIKLVQIISHSGVHHHSTEYGACGLKCTNSELYGLDANGVVWWYNEDEDAWLNMSMEIYTGE